MNRYWPKGRWIEYVPAALTIVFLFALGQASTPIEIAAASIGLGAVGLSGTYRMMIAFVPFMFDSQWVEKKGEVVLNAVSPALLEPPTFVGDTPYWRPGLAAFFILMLAGLCLWILLCRVQGRRWVP